MKSTLQECAIGVTRVLIASLLASIALAPVLGIINVLRNWGLPEFSSVAQTAIFSKIGGSALAGWIEWYNSSMPSYARFGSGIGMMAGAFWAMGCAKAYRLPARIVTGFVVGLIMGARMGLMITSDVPAVLLAAGIGAVWTAIYLGLAGRPSIFKPLPRLNLPVHD